MFDESLLPQYLRNRLQQETIELDSREITYGVGPVDLRPELPFYVGFIDISGESFVFLSEAIPEAHRPAMIAHELSCMTEYRFDIEGCCEATKAELDIVPVELLEEHIRMRILFYEKLIPELPSTGMRDRIKFSLEYLQSRQANKDGEA